jgi:hypothetical protein
MTRSALILAGSAAAAAFAFAPAASAQAPYAPGAYHGAHHARAYAPARVPYGYAWRPGYGWYVAMRPRLPAARSGFVPVGGMVPPGAYGPVGWVTPYQDGTIYADDARRVYAYPTFVYPAATAAYYGTGCLGLSGCAWTVPAWR